MSRSEFKIELAESMPEVRTKLARREAEKFRAIMSNVNRCGALEVYNCLSEPGKQYVRAHYPHLLRAAQFRC